METKLMKKKKGKKWKKFFPSCAHVRFERGRIQHSRVPFSSGVALRCHTFPTLDVETYTFAPVHIVVCLQRSRERKQPRGWSLEKKKKKKKRASGCFYFPTVLFHAVLLILRHRRVWAGFCCVTPISFFLHFSLIKRHRRRRRRRRRCTGRWKGCSSSTVLRFLHEWFLYEISSNF